MKIIDKILRAWRVKIALSHLPHDLSSALDIGCDDGFLLRKLAPSVTRKEGIDPRLESDLVSDEIALRKGFFPAGISEHKLGGPYDAIFALAVFEHFSQDDLIDSAVLIPNLLSPHGRLIVTVPHPFVDRILDILMFFRLIDGQATEEHHGFDPEHLTKCFSNSLSLVKHEKFQFGLNNLFVFEKK